MALYCGGDVVQALKGISFPVTKSQILSYAEGQEALEAVIVALNQLDGQVLFANMASVCRNVAISCSLDTYRALEGLRFPADRESILAYARGKDAPAVVLDALKELPPGYRYESIDEICGLVTSYEGEPTLE